MNRPFDILKNQHENLHLDSRADLGRTELNNEQTKAYEPESASDYFAELENALTLLPDYTKVYDAFNRVFIRCVNQRIADTQLNFGGTFAKVDYLLKELNASSGLTRNINDTRIFLRKRHEILLDEKEQRWRKDLKNICEFISLIYNSEVSDTLCSQWKSTEERQTEATEHVSPELANTQTIRMIVSHWDAEQVYGTSDNGASLVVNYIKNHTYDFDWSYLRTMFYKDAQLNLVRPREIDGVYFPELIIFEPDYLVDISTVANCFTDHGDSAFNSLINKLKPSVNSEAIVLGNFAGQLLDEEIHQLSDSHSYQDSVKDFFKDNSIALATTEISTDFHKNALAQKKNIHRAIHETLPQYVTGFNSREGIVEPSFFSEMLGLQGRMDYLQLDFKVLMEQKSGKGAYFRGDDLTTPHAKESNYVQLLLYMLLIRYNHSEIYEKIKNDFHAFLLYSKYQNALCLMSWAPELTFRAFKVRNGIAWSELLYTTEEGIKILNSLSADQLNTNKVNGPLWERYTKPQLDEFFSQIHNASALEQAYYFRFLTFIAKEHSLAKLGNKTKENSGFASKWYDSLEEKLAAGNIYDNLTLVEPNYDEDGNISFIELNFEEKVSNDMSNFRIGDPVILFPYAEGTEPDLRKAVVFRASIAKCTSDLITLKLRNVQTDARAFRLGLGKKWAIEHDFIDSSDASLFRGMHAFLSAPQSRRDLLLFQREPQIDESVSLVNDYGDFNELSLHVKQAQDFFLIIGPPGTGKTSFGLVNTLMEELSNPQSQVLLLSYTNRAVDEICSKLEEKNLNYIRIGNELACDVLYRSHLLSNQVQHCLTLADLKSKIQRTRIFVSTTASLNANIALFSLKQFDLAIIDEASQILEPHLIGLLSAKQDDQTPSIKKFVMIGDQKQLPAVVQQTIQESRVSQKELNDILLTDCRLSLFERLLKKYGNNPNVTFMLHRQGRMHEDIAQFPNVFFYENKLRIVGAPYCPHQDKELPSAGEGSDALSDIITSQRIAFIAVGAPENSPSDKVNQNEADLIASLVVKIYEHEGKDTFDANETIGVIVPYRNQIATIRNTLEKYGIPEIVNIAIDTVERFQGSQRKYIIYGFTVQKYYQLNFLTNNTYTDSHGYIIDRKLNVAMTRAEEHLIMVGNPELLSRNKVFNSLIEYSRSRQCYYDFTKE